MQNLGDLVNIKTGKLDANAANEDGLYPFFTCAVQPLRINTFAYDCECVLVAGNGDLNVKYYNGKFNAYQRVYIIEIKDKTALDTKYLTRFLSLSLRKLRSNTKGAVIQFIRLGDLTNLKLNLPPLPDQLHIASILSKAENLIAQRKESIRLLDEFLKSTFLEMFGDPVNNIKEFPKGKIRDFVTEVKYGTSKPAEEEGRYPYLRMNNITTAGYWDLTKLKYINMDDEEKEKCVVRKGDLLFNRTNSKELVGKTAVFNLDEEMIIAGYLIRVRFNENINPYFIWGYLNSVHGKQTLLGMCKSIVGMANINAQELQNIKILIPPIELQTQFAHIVEKTETLKSQYQQSLQELENLYGSLSQKAFRGELGEKQIMKTR